jgi:hypothetical protein
VRRRSARLTPALFVSAAVCAGCYGRNHTQREGAYAFAAQEIIRDECGLQSGSSALWSGTMLISGDLVRMRMDDRLYNMEAVGYYLAGLERFSLDGSAGNVTTQANGIECLVTLLQAHLDATTDSPSAFHGATQIRFETDQLGCSCQLWARFTAGLQ